MVEINIDTILAIGETEPNERELLKVAYEDGGQLEGLLPGIDDIG